MNKGKSNPEEKFRLLSKVAIFAGFLLVTVLSFYIYSPVGKSDAAEVTASDGSTYTASISAESNVSIDITPTSTQEIYTGTSKVSYTSTCPNGFTVSLSSGSDTTDLVRDANDASAKTIPTITTGSILTDNTWGYSVNNGSTWKGISKTPVSVINKYSSVSSAQSTDVTFGIKTSSDIPSGIYKNDIIYTVAVKPSCIAYNIYWYYDGGKSNSGVTYPRSLGYGDTIDLSDKKPTKDYATFLGWKSGTNVLFTGDETNININPSNRTSISMTAQWDEHSMQWFKESSLPNVGDSAVLIDSRDGNEYTVKRLADGMIWMTEDLKIAGKRITSNDSNLPSGKTFDIPESNISSFSYDDGVPAAYIHPSYGGFYNFYTATAGWGTEDKYLDDSPMDICPKGWRLPTAEFNNEFQDLYDKYPSPALMKGEPGFTSVGFISGGGRWERNTYDTGYYWSSSKNAVDWAAYLSIDMKGSNPEVRTDRSDFPSHGYAIRCVKEENKTISDITYMQDMKRTITRNTPTGESATLIDKRDNKIYTVRKLDDENVWMTENLAIAGKTITRLDSNVKDDFTISESDISAFEESIDKSKVYIDSYYGGYYSYYTATSGTIGTNTTGSARYDLCPKGWRLPNNSNYGMDFTVLYNKYNSPYLMMDEPNFNLPGYIERGQIQNEGSNGYYWTHHSESDYTYVLDISESSVDPTGTLNKSNIIGASIRCMAK